MTIPLYAFVLAFSVAAPTGAGQNPAQGTLDENDLPTTTPSEILQRAGELFDGSHMFSVTIEHSSTLHIDLLPRSLPIGRSKWTMGEGGRWSFVPQDNQPRFFVDGTNGYIVSSGSERFARLTPHGLDPFAALRHGGPVQSRLALVLGAMVRSGEHITDLELLGVTKHQQRSAYLLMFRVMVPESDRQMRERILAWVSADAPHVPLQLLFIEEASIVEQEQGPNRTVAREMSIAFQGWSFDQPPDELFIFEPDEQMQEMERPFDTRFPPAPEDVVNTDLTGLPVPDVTLNLLDGSTLNLNDVGERIFILDFWATWCLPCIRAMPMLIDVAERYRDQRVQLIAVNLGEDTRTISTFLEARGWSMDVALDPKGDVNDAFGVTALPTTMIVDRDGVVQWQHVGGSPDLREQLEQALDRIIAAD